MDGGKKRNPAFSLPGVFLISGLLFNELEKTGRLNWGRFWMRRGFKIWPSYLFLLLVLALTGATHYVDYHSPLSALGSILVHVFFLQNYLPGGNPNGPTWSLAIEEHFYLLLPILLSLTVWVAARSARNWKEFIPWLTLLVVIACLSMRIITLPVQSQGIVTAETLDAPEGH